MNCCSLRGQQQLLRFLLLLCPPSRPPLSGSGCSVCGDPPSRTSFEVAGGLAAPSLACVLRTTRRSFACLKTMMVMENFFWSSSSMWGFTRAVRWRVGELAVMRLSRTRARSPFWNTTMLWRTSLDANQPVHRPLVHSQRHHDNSSLTSPTNSLANLSTNEFVCHFICSLLRSLINSFFRSLVLPS